MKSKILFMLVVAFLSRIAVADLTCDGHEIMVGDSGRSGTVVLGQSPFSLKWAGDSKDIVGKNILCGVEFGASVVCQTLDHSRGPLVSTRTLCADGAKSPLNNQVGEGYFAYNLHNGNGRFGCSNNAGPEKISKVVEVSNCR